MKTILRAAIMVFSTGTSSAHADGCSPKTLFTSIPGEQSSWVAAPPQQAAITIPNGAVVHPVAPATGCSSRPRTAASADHLQQQC
jgi:hypothetical protein